MNDWYENDRCITSINLLVTNNCPVNTTPILWISRQNRYGTINWSKIRCLFCYRRFFQLFRKIRSRRSFVSRWEGDIIMKETLLGSVDNIWLKCEHNIAIGILSAIRLVEGFWSGSSVYNFYYHFVLRKKELVFVFYQYYPSSRT